MAESNAEILNNANMALRGVRYRRSIGVQSAQLKRGNLMKRIGRSALAVGAVIVGASIIGGIIDGLGFWGLFAALGAAGLAVWASLKFSQMPVPTPDKIVQSDLKTLAGKTEIWLENQRPALPAPAITLVDTIGIRLDALSPQLAKLSETEPAAQEVRKLVGEYLPELVTGYHQIPATLRRQGGAGHTPEDQLISGLKLIDREIANVTEQIARGDLDKLATRGRFLELKYDNPEG
jgi:hypothetical protein